MAYVRSLKIRFSRAHFERGVYYIEKRIVTKPRILKELRPEIFVYGIRHHPLPGETMRVSKPSGCLRPIMLGAHGPVQLIEKFLGDLIALACRRRGAFLVLGFGWLSFFLMCQTRWRFRFLHRFIILEWILHNRAAAFAVVQ